MTGWLARAASLRPGRIAVEAPDGALTYAELLTRVRRTDVASGATVALDASPALDFVVGLHACLERGAIAVPVDPRLATAERERRARALPPPGGALLLFTSGTTGVPQPVALTRANILAQALGSAVALGLDPAERWLCPLPLAHVGGLMVLLRSAIYGTTAVLGPVDLDGVTLASLVPTQLSRALDAGLERPAGLRAILLGGAGAPRPLLERARLAGVPVAQTYGLSQACSSVTISIPGDLETQGAALPAVAVRIAADGEILVSGPTVAGGGELATGDLGRLDEAGRLVVTGRKVDTIVSGGENVAPAEVEAVLLEHPDVLDAAVVGRSDPEWGEAVTAIVVLRGGAGLDPEALKRFARERLAGFEVPKTIEIADAPLPRTASGKLLRRSLHAGSNVHPPGPATR
jgi:O-succinylbenzoic acid--CoA ligase